MLYDHNSCIEMLCNTDENDHGVHTVCAKVNDEFLEWCKEAGNDLITPPS